MRVYRTAQEAFWAGEFGDAYAERNAGPDLIAAKTAMFARILQRAPITSAIEFGANIGLNIWALKALAPTARLVAVEINAKAYDELRTIPGVETCLGSFLDIDPAETFDLSFTSGVLIHIAPDHLGTAYKALYQSSHRYVLVAEYYNPTPVSIPYRGHADRLFKRDWAGEMMDAFSDLRLVDYGFVYRRDPMFPGDDLTWFLMEKINTPSR